MKTTLLFWQTDCSETVDDGHPLEVDQFETSDDLEWAAEQYAEYYHDNRDGWESTWPLTFHVAKVDGTLLGSVEVEREIRAHFVSSKVNPVAVGET